MKILILGGHGMLGHKLFQVLSRKFEVGVTVRKNKFDLKKINFINPDNIFENVECSNLFEIEQKIINFKPNVIINAIGIIKQQSNATAEEFIKINSEFPHQLMKLTKKYDVRLVCISTDCVFDGSKGNYSETEVPNAQDVYGKSKILGEINQTKCLTVRTSIIGREIGNAHGLVEWYLRNKNKNVKGFKNAWFSGLPTVVMAEILGVVIEEFSNLEGIYHISSAPINKFELLNLIKSKFNSKTEILPFEDFRINRSLSGEKFRKATGIEIADWKALIDKMFEDSIQNKNIYQ